MLREQAEAVRARAERLAALVGGTVERDGRARGRRRAPAHGARELGVRGGGGAGGAAARGEPPVVAVVRDGRCLLDCRTLTDAEVDEVRRRRSPLRAR